jgi:hypothetical protein
MTRIVFLTALTALVGCKKDDCTDTGEGACDTGAAEEVAEEEAEEEAPTPASCDFSGAVCIETTNADPAAWCATEGGTHADAACADGYDGMCAIPGGQDGTYADAATAYYYGMDGATACSDVGGTYTAS